MSTLKIASPKKSRSNHRISTKNLDIKTMESWLWNAACSIRGAQDAPKFKDFILPLVFFKRLSDVFDDELQEKIEEYGDRETALSIITADHHDSLKTGRRAIVRCFIPEEYSWKAIRDHKADGKLGEFVTEAMRKVGQLNPELQGIVDQRDFNERQSGQRTVDDDRLSNLIESLSKHRLGLDDTEPDILGRAYEYLLRKFAEGQGQSAGEFYTPKEVGWLIAKLLDPKPKSTVYDPTCGSGGLLIKARMVFEENHPEEKGKAPKLYGQELTATTFAIAKMNMFLHDYYDSHLQIGDTLRHPKFSADGAGLTQFNYVVANPMWNQPGYDATFYENDAWNRFSHGTPTEKADWAWLQHIVASLNKDGKAAVVLDTGAISRGSGSKNRDRERDIRRNFIENDLIEGIILLPDNLFYNTTAAGIIILLNCNKPKDRKEQIILINASQLFYKEKPKNFLSEEGIAKICEVCREWKSVEKFSRIIIKGEAKDADYNLSPSQFVTSSEITNHRQLKEIIEDILETKTKSDAAQKNLIQLLSMLKIQS